jgi:hypothetical protein
MAWVLRRSIFYKMLILALCLLAWNQPPVVLAQHVAGHVGGGGARVIAPPFSRPPLLRPPISRPFSAASPVGAFRTGGSLLLRPGPFRPRPIYPIYGYPFYGYPSFGPQAQFWWFWSVWGSNSCAWTNCYFWNWNTPSNILPFYQYAPGNVAAPSYSLYVYGQGRDLPELFLKDGTVYSVSDYWLADGQVHFKAYDERSGKPEEHVIALDDLDLQATVDVNTRRGFRFVLRDEPMEQYLQHHPNEAPPDWTPPNK